MSNIIVARSTFRNFGTVHRFEIDGRVYDAADRFKLARLLIAEGHDATTWLRTVTTDGQPAFKPRTLAELARWAISEGDRVGITIRLHDPDAIEAMKARFSRARQPENADA